MDNVVAQGIAYTTAEMWRGLNRNGRWAARSGGCVNLLIRERGEQLTIIIIIIIIPDVRKFIP